MRFQQHKPCEILNCITNHCIDILV